jgi:hypothetical protein
VIHRPRQTQTQSASKLGMRITIENEQLSYNLHRKGSLSLGVAASVKQATKLRMLGSERSGQMIALSDYRKSNAPQCVRYAGMVPTADNDPANSVLLAAVSH